MQWNDGRSKKNRENNRTNFIKIRRKPKKGEISLDPFVLFGLFFGIIKLFFKSFFVIFKLLLLPYKLLYKLLHSTLKKKN